MSAPTNTNTYSQTVAPDNLHRLAKLHAMLCISYGQLIIDLGDKHSVTCVPGDLSRVYHDAKQLADYVHTLAEGIEEGCARSAKNLKFRHFVANIDYEMLNVAVYNDVENENSRYLILERVPNGEPLTHPIILTVGEYAALREIWTRDFTLTDGNVLITIAAIAYCRNVGVGL